MEREESAQSDGRPDCSCARGFQTRVGRGGGTGTCRSNEEEETEMKKSKECREIVLDFEGPIQGQALRVAAKSTAILDRPLDTMAQSVCGRGGEWLRRGQTKECARGPVQCQDFVITIREGRHQFYWHKKQEQSRISPSDTVVMLIARAAKRSNKTAKKSQPSANPAQALS